MVGTACANTDQPSGAPQHLDRKPPALQTHNREPKEKIHAVPLSVHNTFSMEQTFSFRLCFHVHLPSFPQSVFSASKQFVLIFFSRRREEEIEGFMYLPSLCIKGRCVETKPCEQYF